MDPSFHKRNCTIPRIHCPHSTFHSFEWQSSAKTRTELRPSAIQVLSHVKLKHPTQTTALVPDADRPGYFFGVKFPHDMPSNNIGESHVYYIYIIYIIYTYLRNQHPKVLSVYSITQTWRQIRHIWKWDCTRHYNKLWRGLAKMIFPRQLTIGLFQHSKRFDSFLISAPLSKSGFPNLKPGVIPNRNPFAAVGGWVSTNQSRSNPRS